MRGVLDLLLCSLLMPVLILPRHYRVRLVQILLEREERRGSPREVLRFLLAVEDVLVRSLDRAAMAYGAGTHPKHRLTGYHEFFIMHTPPGARVLDVGCGTGELSADIAAQVPGSQVTGVDILPERIEAAFARRSLPNLRFIRADILHDTVEGKFDVVVLSNVLEHLDARVELLRRLRQKTGARRFLVRVPLYERHWTIPLRQELGLAFFSDPTHRVEHTQEQIRAELEAAGLQVVTQEVRWGECWLVAEGTDG